MPDKMSGEKIRLLRAYGAKVVITPTAVEPDDPRSYYKVADRIVAETPNSILANQYHNPENPRSHYQTTGPEIWEQTGGRVTDVFIGHGHRRHDHRRRPLPAGENPKVRIVGVDPLGSILYETHKIGRVPATPPQDLQDRRHRRRFPPHLHGPLGRGRGAPGGDEGIHAHHPPPRPRKRHLRRRLVWHRSGRRPALLPQPGPRAHSWWSSCPTPATATCQDL